MYISGKHSRKFNWSRQVYSVLLIGLWLMVALEWSSVNKKIAARKQDPLLSFPSYTHDSIPELNLVIDRKDWNKLERTRKEALKSGILAVSEEQIVSSRLEQGDQHWDAKLRLKGDWVDHLRGNKWSFRVSLKTGQAWEGLTTFSLQTPQARDFLNEFVFHKLLEKVDVLTTRYTFVWLKINQISYGIYALEEHFEKQLVESRKRREGPILKFSEDGLWKSRQREFLAKCRFIDDEIMMNAANIEAFGMSKVHKSPVLNNEFLIAQNLMAQLRDRKKTAGEVLDVDRVMRYFAVSDLCRTYHNFIWHNQRWYYNPITQKLEPIGYDGDTGGGFAYKMKTKTIPEGGGQLPPMLWRLLMNDQNFQQNVSYLDEYASEAWLSAFFEENEAEIRHWERLIAREFPGYTFDKAQFLENAALVRKRAEKQMDKTYGIKE